MDVENTSYLLKNLEKMSANTSLTENLTVDSNNISNITKETDKRNLIIMIDFHVYGTIVTSSIGVLTNILVAAAISVSWKFWRHSLGTLLLTLACVDIIGNGVCFTYYLLPIYQKYFFPPTFLYLNNGFKRLSYLMMIPISANRYALICRPFTHRKIATQKSTLIQITTLIIFVFSTGIYQFMKKRQMMILCHIVIDVTLSAVLPFIISFILTILVLCEFRRMNRTLEDAVRTGADSRQGERNVTRTMIAVNVAFIVLTFPSILTRVINLFFRGNDFEPTHTGRLLVLIQDINYSVNIFIYTIYLPKFRSTMFRFFACRSCRKRRNRNESLAMSVL